MITLKYCNIPAIGDSSFWPGNRLLTLDLTGNQLVTIQERDFNGLTNLTSLDLSSNLISDPPSAPFKYLQRLQKLSLANNLLTKLVPRMFYQLRQLELLNLSNNPLIEIQPDDIKDVVQLKQLYLNSCKLNRVHSLIYARLNALELLDLTNNRFDNLVQYEFKRLKKLKVLKLTLNRLIILQDYTFYGLDLIRLYIDQNYLQTIGLCAFCNSSIKILNLSRNHLFTIDINLFSPLSESLQILNLSNNSKFQDASIAIENAVKPLRKLIRAYLSSINLDDRLNHESFYNCRESLKVLVLSDNRFINISEALLSPLKQLEILDLSNNLMQGMSKQLVDTLKTLKNLNYIDLEGSNWMCYRCHILFLRNWLNTNAYAYENACQKGIGKCVKCSSPSDLYELHVKELNEFQMEWCPDPTIRLRLATSEPRVGLILAIIIIITLIVVIIIVVILYKQRGGSYYTHEDDRLDAKTIITIQRTAAATALDTPSTSTQTSSNNSLSQHVDSIASEQQSSNLPSLPIMPAPPTPPQPDIPSNSDISSID